MDTTFYKLFQSCFVLFFFLFSFYQKLRSTFQFASRDRRKYRLSIFIDDESIQIIFIFECPRSGNEVTVPSGLAACCFRFERSSKKLSDKFTSIFANSGGQQR